MRSCFVAVLFLSVPALAAPLITDSEAGLPAAAPPVVTRAITRGPGVKVVSPDPSAESVKSPFNLKVVFEPRGGAKIDPGATRISYLKSPPVDLIERVKPGLSDSGIQLNSAEVPPGEHKISLTVQDSEGRKTNTVIHFKVVK